jgi:hypothetical protein
MKQSMPSANVSSVYTHLVRTGTFVTDTRNNVRTPRINVDRAVESLGTISIKGSSAREGSSLTFKITLSRTYPATVRVSYRTLNGSAEAGTDFASRSGELSFAPGEREKTVSVPTYWTYPYNGYTSGYEGTTKWFAMDLWGPSGANIGVRYAKAYIRS